MTIPKSPAPPITRSQFISRIPKTGLILEIGPFTAPTFAGDNVRYFDVMSGEDIRRVAVDLNRDPVKAPATIHYVQREISLQDIPERFDAIYSSHCIEHTLDAVGHVNSAATLLEPGGKYFLIVPDKRYCFDYYKPAASIASVIEAAETKPTEYSLRTWIDRAVRSTHSEPARHWTGDHGPRHKPNVSELVRKAIKEYKSGYRLPMGPHIWCFTPEIFAEIFHVTYELGYTKLRVLDIHETRLNSLEFYAVLGH